VCKNIFIIYYFFIDLYFFIIKLIRKQKTKENEMTIDKAYIYKRKDGETIFCYGELNEGDNIDITLDCDADELDGVACDIDVTDPKTNTWRKICEYLESNYSSKISELQSV
jgi:hypothetical protein